ncbi:restin homolog [Onthophagus taurus]|uniref:restin homolog n=1 Tax=Onthophagus taurus TaxID=166361 RepID=UPI0039BE090B
MDIHKKFPQPKPVKVEVDIDQVPNLATEKTTLPQLEAWNNDILSSLMECTSSRDIKTFLSILKKYSKFLKKDSGKCWDRVIFIKSIQRHVMAMADYFSAHPENVKYEFEYVFYITKIIGLYCTLELDAHRNALINKCDFVVSVTNRLLSLMFVSLRFTSGRVSDVLLRIEYSRTNKFHSAVMKRLYHHCLLTMPVETSSYPGFYSYYLNYQDMQELTPKHLRSEQQKYLLQSFGKTQEEVKDDLILKKILETPSSSTVKTVEHIVFPRKRTTRAYFKYLRSTQSCHVPSDRNITDMMQSVGISTENDSCKSLSYPNTFDFSENFVSSSEESESESEHENIICEIDIDSDCEITYVKKQPPKRKERHKRRKRHEDLKRPTFTTNEVIVLDSDEDEVVAVSVPNSESIFGNDKSDSDPQSLFKQIEYAALRGDFSSLEFHHGLITPPREQRCGLFDDASIREDEDCERGIFESYNNDKETFNSDEIDRVSIEREIRVGEDEIENTIENTIEKEISGVVEDEGNDLQGESEEVCGSLNENDKIVNETNQITTNEIEENQEQEVVNKDIEENLDCEDEEIGEREVENVEENREIVPELIVNEEDEELEKSNQIDEDNVSIELSQDQNKESESEESECGTDMDKSSIHSIQSIQSVQSVVEDDKIDDVIHAESENIIKINESDFEKFIQTEMEVAKIMSPSEIEKISVSGLSMESSSITSDAISELSVSMDEIEETSTRVEPMVISGDSDLNNEVDNDKHQEKSENKSPPRVLYKSTCEEFNQFDPKINQSNMDFPENEFETFLSGPVESNRLNDQYYGENDLPSGDLFALVNNGFIPLMDVPPKLPPPIIKSSLKKPDKDLATIPPKKVVFSDEISQELVFDRLVEILEKRPESPTPSPVFEKWQKRYTGEFKKVLKDINKAVDISGGFPQFSEPSKSYVLKQGVKCYVNRTADEKVFWDAAVQLELLTSAELRKYNVWVPLEHNTRTTCLLKKYSFKKKEDNNEQQSGRVDDDFPFDDVEDPDNPDYFLDPVVDVPDTSNCNVLDVERLEEDLNDENDEEIRKPSIEIIKMIEEFCNESSSLSCNKNLKEIESEVVNVNIDECETQLGAIEEEECAELKTQEDEIQIEPENEECESTKVIFETIHEIAISLGSNQTDRNEKLKALTKLLTTIISKEDPSESNVELKESSEEINSLPQAIAIQTDSNLETSENHIETKSDAIQTETSPINEEDSSSKIADVVGDKLILDMSKFNNTEFDVQAIKDAINTQNGKFNEEAVVKVLVEISSNKDQISAEPLQESLIDCLSGNNEEINDEVEKETNLCEENVKEDIKKDKKSKKIKDKSKSCMKTLFGDSDDENSEIIFASKRKQLNVNAELNVNTELNITENETNYIDYSKLQESNKLIENNTQPILKEKLKHQKHKSKHINKLLKSEKSSHKHVRKLESLATLSRNTLKSHKNRRKSTEKALDLISPYVFSENNEKCFGEINYTGNTIAEFKQEVKRRKSIEQQKEMLLPQIISKEIYDTDTETADESVISVATCISVKKQQCLYQVYNKNRNKSTPLEDGTQRSKRKSSQNKKRRKANEDPLYRAQCANIQNNKICPYGTRQHWDLREYTLNEVIDIGRKGVLEPLEITNELPLINKENEEIINEKKNLENTNDDKFNSNQNEIAYDDDSSRDLVICSDESCNSIDRASVFNLNNVTNDETNISPLIFNPNFYLNKNTVEKTTQDHETADKKESSSKDLIERTQTPENNSFEETNEFDNLKRKWDYEDDDIIYWTLVKDKYMLPPKKRCRVSSMSNQIADTNIQTNQQDDKPQQNYLTSKLFNDSLRTQQGLNLNSLQNNFFYPDITNYQINQQELPSYNQIFGGQQPSTSLNTKTMEDPIQIMDDGSYKVSLTEEKVLRGEVNSMLRSEKNAQYIMAVLTGNKDNVACPFDFEAAEDMKVADFETVCNYVLSVITQEFFQNCYNKSNEVNQPKKNNNLSEDGSYTAVKGLNCASALIYRRLLVKCLRRLRPVFKTPAERKQMPIQFQQQSRESPLISTELRPLPMEPPPPYTPSPLPPPPQNIVVKFINPFVNPAQSSSSYSVPEIHVKLETSNVEEQTMMGGGGTRRTNCATFRIT